MTESSDLAGKSLLRRRQLAPSRGDVAGASGPHTAKDPAAVLTRRPLADRIAAEHGVATAAPRRWPQPSARRAIFLAASRGGPGTTWGLHHVLPTARSARFSSGRRARLHEAHLGPQLDRKGLEQLGRAMALARAEGLEAHRRSVAIRLAAGDKS